VLPVYCRFYHILLTIKKAKLNKYFLIEWLQNIAGLIRSDIFFEKQVPAPTFMVALPSALLGNVRSCQVYFTRANMLSKEVPSIAMKYLNRGSSFFF
jgi:hypothetical protein